MSRWTQEQRERAVDQVEDFRNGGMAYWEIAVELQCELKEALDLLQEGHACYCPTCSKVAYLLKRHGEK